MGWRLIQYQHRLVSVDPEEGASTIVHLASSPTVEGMSGMYFQDCAAVPSSSTSRDPQPQAMLWEVSERLTASQRVTARLPHNARRSRGRPTGGR